MGELGAYSQAIEQQAEALRQQGQTVIFLAGTANWPAWSR